MHQGEYTLYFFLHCVHFQHTLWTICHMERTETVTAPGLAFSTTQDWQSTSPDITTT